MSTIKTVGDKTYEFQDYQIHTRRSDHGRASVQGICPFCGVTSTLYLWSLSGCGKKCSCGALFTRAYVRKQIDRQ